MSIKKILTAALVCAAATVAFGQAPIDPCTQTTKLSQSASGVETYTANSSGNKPLPGSPYGYEMWTEGGNNNKLIWFGPNQGGGAAFRTEWNNPNDYLGRVGYFMNQGKPWTSYKHMYCDYNYTRVANGNGGGYSYIGLYGWTKSPQVEWYIVEDWFTAGILSSSGILGTQKGEFTTADGVKYKIWRNTRPAGSGNILNDGKAFPQYFSVRQRDNSSTTATTHTCGTIYVNEHFEAFEQYADMKMGTDLYEVKFLVEAGGGTGWFEASYLKFTQEETPRGLPDGNFVLSTDVNPATSGEITRSSNASYYPTGTKIGLTAEPAAGWEFTGWSGDLTGTKNPDTVTLNANKSVVANFALKADGSNLVKNGDFSAASENGLGGGDSWKLNKWGNSAASHYSADGAVTININTLPTTGNSYDLQLVQAGIPLIKGNKYLLTFEAKAASARTISVVLQMPDDPWTDFLRDTSVALTTTMETFTYEFEMTADDFPNGRLGFDFGNATPAVTIGNVSLVLQATVSISDKNIPQPNVKKSSLKVTAKKSAVNVKFKAKNSGTAELRLYGLKGNLVTKASLQTVAGKSYSHTFNAGKLPNGFYIVSVHSNGSIEKSRVIMPK
jgi:uncharacterized repeat protein (TIGR02543 family)